MDELPETGNNGGAPSPMPPDLCRLTTYDFFENGGLHPCAAEPFVEGMVMIPVVMSVDTSVPCVSSQYMPYDAPMAAPVAPPSAPPSPPTVFPQVMMMAPPPLQLSPVAKAVPTPPVMEHDLSETEQQPLSERFAAPQPQSLLRGIGDSNGIYSIEWTVDSRKLTAADRVAVSAPFELTCCGVQVNFRMMLYPRMSSDAKGGASFRKARGKGIVQLKCEAQLQEELLAGSLKFRIAIGSGHVGSPRWEATRGPVVHQFVKGAICGLPKGQDLWDFGAVVNQESQTFVVRLEILP